MRQWSVAGWSGVLAAVVSAMVFVLLMYRASAMRDGGALSLDPLGWTLLIVSLACFCLSVILTMYGHFLRTSLDLKASTDGGLGPTLSDTALSRPAPGSIESIRLTEDERRLYETIRAAGGEILQMNLVSSGEFSKSKVTRLLDKLEGKGLIRRERHGMTNKVILME